jgi:cell shape-determining protein MreC
MAGTPLETQGEGLPMTPREAERCFHCGGLVNYGHKCGEARAASAPAGETPVDRIVEAVRARCHEAYGGTEHSRASALMLDDIAFLLSRLHAREAEIAQLRKENDRLRGERDLAYQSAHLAETQEYNASLNRAGAEALLEKARAEIAQLQRENAELKELLRKSGESTV